MSGNNKITVESLQKLISHCGCILRLFSERQFEYEQWTHDLLFLAMKHEGITYWVSISMVIGEKKAQHSSEDIQKNPKLTHEFKCESGIEDSMDQLHYYSRWIKDQKILAFQLVQNSGRISGNKNPQFPNDAMRIRNMLNVLLYFLDTYKEDELSPEVIDLLVKVVNSEIIRLNARDKKRRARSELQDS